MILSANGRDIIMMCDENDWTRLAMSLDAIRETLLDGTHGVFAGSDSVTVKTDTWVQTVIELRRAQKQCTAYGEMHCPRVPGKGSNE
jgi:hypothetical protein